MSLFMIIYRNQINEKEAANIAVDSGISFKQKKEEKKRKKW